MNVLLLYFWRMMVIGLAGSDNWDSGNGMWKHQLSY